MTEHVEISQRDKESFLKLARRAISVYLTEKRVLKVSEFETFLPQIKDEHLGVFVTLTKDDLLRGCIGYVEGFKPLAQGIIDNAINASTKDPRFPELRIDELAEIKIEISVLSPIKPVTDINNIEVGVHGLIISKGLNAGLLLPQVAVEWGWDRQEFLEHTCEKAGLPRDAWEKGAEIKSFTATVFNEKTN
jgi:uncharacterized protein